MSRRGSRVQFSFFPPKTVCRCPSASQQGSGKHFKISLLPIGCRAATGQQPFRWISGKQNNPQFWVISSAARAVSLHLNGRWFESAMTQKISVAAHWPPRRGGQGQKRFKNFHCLPLAANCLLPKGQSLVTATAGNARQKQNLSASQKRASISPVGLEPTIFKTQILNLPCLPISPRRPLSLPSPLGTAKESCRPLAAPKGRQGAEKAPRKFALPKGGQSSNLYKTEKSKNEAYFCCCCPFGAAKCRPFGAAPLARAASVSRCGGPN